MKPKRSCPKHNVRLEPKKTQFGIRRSCPIEGCTVVCWDGRTSTPADLETRNARRVAHAAFDPLWRETATTKGELYKDLAEYMGLEQKNAHIGHFNQEQCKQVMAFCEQLESEASDANQQS